MRTRVIAGVVVPVVVLAGAAGYVWADAYDHVPGWVTVAAEPEPPAPFLSAVAVEAAPAPGAVLHPLLDPSAPLPSASAVQALAQALRDDSRTGRSTNVSVIDLVTGEVLADLDASDGQVPASTTKLLTGIAAVAGLGPDFQIPTVARYDAARGEVALVAGGDMMLAADAGNKGEPPHTGSAWGGDMPAVGYAGLGDLADQVVAALAAEGVTSVKVVIDTAAFPGPAYPLEWPAYARTSGYAAPVTGLAVNVGKLADDLYAPRAQDPAAAAGDAFAERLSERGITATRAGARSNSTGIDVGTVLSAPLADQVAFMIHSSDNTIAEVLSRVLSLNMGYAGTPDAAAYAVIEQLAGLGVDTTGLSLYDGAGFSTRNRIPPRVLTESMRQATLHERTQGVFDWLAVAGMSGTLADRFVSAPGAGVMRAKTGSLTGVTSLAGVVMTADGRPLLFAALADGMPYGPVPPRQAVDEFVNALAQCGCRD